MNKNRRERLNNINRLIDVYKSELEDILNEEQDYYDNIPENLLGSERADISEEAISNLEDVVSSLEDVIEKIEEVTA